MRLSGLVAAVVLFSAAVFAQHSSTSGAPSSPPPSPPPSAAPSSPPPAPAPSPSPSISSTASSASSTPSVSHSSAPSSPSPVSIPESHAAPVPSSSGSHASGIEERIEGQDRIVASPKIGEAPRTKEKDSKTAEAELQRRICPDGPCKEPEPKATESDLRRPICKDRDCGKCPAGESAGKSGACVSTMPADTAANTAASHACQANETWNGAACTPNIQCGAGEIWDGIRCASSAQCTSIDSRAAGLASEIRGARANMEGECRNDPSSQRCSDLKTNYDGAVQRYRILMNEAPVHCRTTLLDPLSL
jgi:hypothetical protein